MKAYKIIFQMYTGKILSFDQKNTLFNFKDFPTIYSIVTVQVNYRLRVAHAHRATGKIAGNDKVKTD